MRIRCRAMIRRPSWLVLFVALGCGSSSSPSLTPDAAEPELPADAGRDRGAVDVAAPASPDTGAPAVDTGARDQAPPADALAGDAAKTPDAPAASCTPDPGAALVTKGEVVFDPRTCLSWMKATKESVNLNPMFPPDAITYCEQLSLGGFDDWRVPTVSELASIITRCGKYPPEGPWEPLFDVKGDGYWTTTSAGQPRKVCAIGTANAGKFYEYGIDGPQVVRCVRGAGVVKPARDCTTGATCADWYQ
jgi:hypothetical protein